MKRTLLATAILVLLLPGAYAAARDHTYQIKPGLTAVVTVSGQNRHTVSARVGKGPVQQLAVMDDEAVDVFETPDIDHDGYADLAIGQSGGGTQARMRLFLYRPNEGRYQEIRHPAPEASPCHGFVNPVFDAGKPAFSTGCRYSADSQERKATPCAQTARPFPCPGSRRSGSRRQARRSRPGTSSTATARWPESCWTAKARRSTAATTWRPRPRRSL